MQCVCCQAFTEIGLGYFSSLLFCILHIKLTTAFLTFSVCGSMFFVFLFFFGTALEQCCDVAPGLAGMILLVLCFIDFSAMWHYVEHGSGDGLRSVP